MKPKLITNHLSRYIWTSQSKRFLRAFTSSRNDLMPHKPRSSYVSTNNRVLADLPFQSTCNPCKLYLNRIYMVDVCWHLSEWWRPLQSLDNAIGFVMGILNIILFAMSENVRNEKCLSIHWFIDSFYVIYDNAHCRKFICNLCPYLSFLSTLLLYVLDCYALTGNIKIAIIVMVIRSNAEANSKSIKLQKVNRWLLLMIVIKMKVIMIILIIW